ncbi:unnamed protein product [Symbiodinium sp. CCMP2592]|nr:unnamed protein product [Symbiodinium sp. CCMP2592]
MASNNLPPGMPTVADMQKLMTSLAQMQYMMLSQGQGQGQGSSLPAQGEQQPPLETAPKTEETDHEAPEEANAETGHEPEGEEDTQDFEEEQEEVNLEPEVPKASPPVKKATQYEYETPDQPVKTIYKRVGWYTIDKNTKLEILARLHHRPKKEEKNDGAGVGSVREVLKPKPKVLPVKNAVPEPPGANARRRRTTTAASELVALVPVAMVLEAQKDVKQASLDIPASTPSVSKQKKRSIEPEGEGSSTKRPRSLFQTPTPRTKVKKESEEDEQSDQSDRESLGDMEGEDNDLFGEGRFALKGAPEPAEAPGKTKEEPKEELHDKPKEEPQGEEPGVKDEHWQSLDDDMKAMLQTLEGELLDALPTSASANDVRHFVKILCEEGILTLKDALEFLADADGSWIEDLGEQSLRSFKSLTMRGKKAFTDWPKKLKEWTEAVLCLMLCISPSVLVRQEMEAARTEP